MSIRQYVNMSIFHLRLIMLINLSDYFIQYRSFIENKIDAIKITHAKVYEVN
jgi:hypothetical protein